MSFAQWSRNNHKYLLGFGDSLNTGEGAEGNLGANRYLSHGLNRHTLSLTPIVVNRIRTPY